MPPCHVGIPFRRDEKVFAPPCHVDNLSELFGTLAPMLQGFL